MGDQTFSELIRGYLAEHREKCPDLLMPRLRQIAADPPFPSGTYEAAFDTLNLKVFLDCVYPHQELHTVPYTSKSILEDLKKVYPDFTFYDTPYFFLTWGMLASVPLLSLKYYQDEIDLRGRHPLNIRMDEPVLVVKYATGMVLYNGYHRATFQMLVKKNNIQAYIIDI
jgi:hypothetical protein